MIKITGMDVADVRFPTSRQLDGSDAMNPDPDYSASYVVLRTDADDGLEGHGFTFTIGRGNEVVCAAIEALRPLVLGWPVEQACADKGHKVVMKERELRPGVKIAMVEDPDGNWVEFLAVN